MAWCTTLHSFMPRLRQICRMRVLTAPAIDMVGHKARASRGCGQIGEADRHLAPSQPLCRSRHRCANDEYSQRDPDLMIPAWAINAHSHAPVHVTSHACQATWRNRTAEGISAEGTTALGVSHQLPSAVESHRPHISWLRRASAALVAHEPVRRREERRASRRVWRGPSLLARSTCLQRWSRWACWRPRCRRRMHVSWPCPDSRGP